MALYKEILKCDILKSYLLPDYSFFKIKLQVVVAFILNYLRNSF